VAPFSPLYSKRRRLGQPFFRLRRVELILTPHHPIFKPPPPFFFPCLCFFSAFFLTLESEASCLSVRSDRTPVRPLWSVFHLALVLACLARSFPTPPSFQVRVFFGANISRRRAPLRKGLGPFIFSWSCTCSRSPLLFLTPSLLYGK